MAEARRAEKGRPGHTKGGGKRSRWGGKKPARASGSQPPWRAMFDATQRPNLRYKTSTPEQRRMGSVRPVAPARDSPGDSLPDVSARGPCATRSARPAAPSWPCRSRITSKRSKSAPKLDHGPGRPHHRRARGVSTASRRTPHEPSPWPTAGPPAYAHGPWARAAPSPLLRRGHVPVGCACAAAGPVLVD